MSGSESTKTFISINYTHTQSRHAHVNTCMSCLEMHQYIEILLYCNIFCRIYIADRDGTIQNLKVLMHCHKNIMIQQYITILEYVKIIFLQNRPTFSCNPILLQCQLNNLTCTFKIISMLVMLFKSVHPIIAIHCNTRYIDTLKVVSIPVSLSTEMIITVSGQFAKCPTTYTLFL